MFGKCISVCPHLIPSLRQRSKSSTRVYPAESRGIISFKATKNGDYSYYCCHPRANSEDRNQSEQQEQKKASNNVQTALSARNLYGHNVSKVYALLGSRTVLFVPNVMQKCASRRKYLLYWSLNFMKNFCP